ncbi:MAG: type II toxin-antitoxin system VapC family toxin [Terracidiphilus sp.]
MPESSYLLDTNILLRLVQPDSPEYGTIRQCTDRLWALGADLFFTSQNLAEFWNVCTRPADRNGFGFSVAETDERALLIESRFSLLPDTDAIHREWRRLVVSENVSGTQVHDARLAAAMRVHGIPNLLTLNTRDFRRFAGIAAVSPQEILASIG